MTEDHLPVRVRPIEAMEHRRHTGVGVEERRLHELGSSLLQYALGTQGPEVGDPGQITARIRGDRHQVAELDQILGRY
jgi:hypothetical protein